MFVIGTAGHVDHGKSTLVRALTGIDPDRLREEKERGLTIELGFAWLTLPSGREVSIVDVPGHERFVKNMLMGVAGVDVALMVVAADEGVMPQTREHLAIIELMGIGHGVVAVTKSDAADEDLIAIVSEEIQELLDGTSLAGSKIVPVSARSGEGLSKLGSALDESLSGVQARRDLGRPRLPVDRSFTISGFGTVVTGTLADGVFKPGQEVEILPSGRRARIRGLQSHEREVAEATPGSRVAVNLSGIDHLEVARGDVLAEPGWLKASSIFDGSFRTISLAPRPLRHNHRVTLFASTFEVEASVRVLGQDEILPGSDGWVQLKLDTAAPLVKGDHFVIRDPNDTLGGGTVLELMPVRHRRNNRDVTRRLESLGNASAEDAILAAIERSQPATLASIGRTANVSEADAASAVDELAHTGLTIVVQPGGLVFTSAGWNALQSSVTDILGTFHRQFPLRPGLQREELRSRLGLKAAAFGPVVQALSDAGVIAIEGSIVRLTPHAPTLGPSEEQEIGRFKSALAANRFSPPTTRIDTELLQLLIQRGEVVRAAEDVVYLAEAYREMVAGLVAHAEQHGEISIDDVRSIYGTSRKYTLALLEQMDRDNLTIRRGDVRVLRR